MCVSKEVNQKTTEDEKLLSEFKEDFTKVLEYIIDTDFSAELIKINLSYTLDDLISKWNKKRYKFKFKQIENTKNSILYGCSELKNYLSIEYLRLHESSGMLIFKNDSYEAGEKLREELRPQTVRIRTELKLLLDELYEY